MAKTTDWNKRFDNIRLAKLDYEEKDIKDILNNLYEDDDENKIICEDIIKNLESTAVKEINNNKCVQLPFIGSIRKNPLRNVVDKHRTNFKIAFKSLSKEGFKEHCAEVIKREQDNLKLEDYKKAKFKELRRKYKKRYEQLFTNIGPAYANMFILSRMSFRAVEFNEEFEEIYQKLNKNE